MINDGRMGTLVYPLLLGCFDPPTMEWNIGVHIHTWTNSMLAAEYERMTQWYTQQTYSLTHHMKFKNKQK